MLVTPRSFPDMGYYRTYSVFLTFRLDCLIFNSEFRGIYKSVWICIGSFWDGSGLVNIFRLFPMCHIFFRLLPVFLFFHHRPHRHLPNHSQLASCFVRDVPFRMFLRISSRFPYLPSNPRRQCRFIRVISADTAGTVSLRCLFSLSYKGPEINFR